MRGQKAVRPHFISPLDTGDETTDQQRGRTLVIDWSGRPPKWLVLTKCKKEMQLKVGIDSSVTETVDQSKSQQLAPEIIMPKARAIWRVSMGMHPVAPITETMFISSSLRTLNDKDKYPDSRAFRPSHDSADCPRRRCHCWNAVQHGHPP